MTEIRQVAVIGAGPAGATLGALLARRGVRVGVFSRGSGHDPAAGPLIGESTVPALVPVIRELGIEDEVRGYSTFKPGATFTVHTGESLLIDFATVGGRVPGYAYNVPRDRFDRTVLDACVKSGATLFPFAAKLERTTNAPGEAAVRLSDETRAATEGFFAEPPDLIVDASGRSRVLSRLLDLPSAAGKRRDTALFAHCDDVPIENPGHIHTDRLEHGWCWRIPLPDRVSMGFVLDSHRLRALAERPEDQYDALLRTDSELQRLAGGACRRTPVLKFNNYQQITQVGAGNGWALVGDALGFVDPVFSSGLFLAMEGAWKLADAISAGTDRRLQRYQRRQRGHIAAWQRVVDYFYDGRFFAMLRLRDMPHENWIGRSVGPHLGRHLPRVFTGESTADRYDPRLLDFVMKYSLGVLEDPDWARWKIED
jgi:hypothetical protein